MSALGMTKSANLARVRENQRRCRARQKEYIQDLERRLQEYERRGVEATIEVQSAARRVVEENAQLRSLLRLRGVTDVEVDGYLQNEHSRGYAISNGSSVSTPGVDTYHEPRVAGKPTKPMLQAMKLSEDVTREQPAAKMRDEPRQLTEVFSANGQLHPEPTWSDRPDNYPQSIPEFAAETYRPAPRGNVSRGLESDDATSCNEAASIIASMRGHNDAQAVRAELGCAPDIDCKVKNMVIFHALDT
ncbi:hypothetical protein AJ80_07245 [Polytolypa hystricis UAMH7299]|uniref:BZIP domain-containing protein n=1 Tax=Polytolypa hystricis (strain UAMH7299) TaxID=1447883 RepID=A0A2B7XQV6_POLH7|nr:hypothetical protein AJ80_07245 [Polytolypa hystricis UAMH7299]